MSHRKLCCDQHVGRVLPLAELKLEKHVEGKNITPSLITPSLRACLEWDSLTVNIRQHPQGPVCWGGVLQSAVLYSSLLPLSSLSLAFGQKMPRSEVGQKVTILKVHRMGLPIVESLSGLQEGLFRLFRSPQVHSAEKSKNRSNYIRFIDFPLSPCFCLGSLGLLLFSLVKNACSEDVAEVLGTLIW